MSKPNVVTGDDVIIPVTLKKDGSVFAIADTATVKTRLVSSGNDAVYTVEQTQSKDTTGADWANSLVMAVIPSADTANVTYQGLAKLEIQVDDGGKKTWFVVISITKGQIA